MKEIVRKNRGWVLLYVLSGTAIAFLENFGASRFQRLIDDFSAGTLMTGTILIYGGALLGGYLCNYLDEYPGRRLEHGIYLDFKRKALEKISAVRYDAWQKLGTGKLVQRIENGAQAGKGILFDFYLCLFRQLIPSILFSIWFIWRINRQITYVILTGYLVVFVISNILLKKLYEVKEKILIREEDFNHFLVRGFMEMPVFRMYRRYGSELKKAEKAKTEIVRGKVKVTMVHEAFFTIFALMMAFLKIGLIFYAWNTQTITIGTVVALITLVDNAYTPIAIFNVLYVGYRLDRTAYDRLKEFFELPEEERLTAGLSVKDIRGDIRVENLDFAYEGRQVLKNISLHIRPGEKVAFVGETGCGKSTLVKLMAGLLFPVNGKVEIDGQDLSDFCLNDYYGQISFVPQDGSIFDGTIEENLAITGTEDGVKFKKALQDVNFSDTLSKMADGFATQLGEHGAILSGGEKQRLALARVLLDDSGIIFLDESTSAIDNLNEEEIMSRVMERLSGRTLIMIAHRLNTVRLYDRIVVFKDGRIAADGKFCELLESCDYFRELYLAGEQRPGAVLEG